MKSFWKLFIFRTNWQFNKHLLFLFLEYILYIALMMMFLSKSFCWNFLTCFDFYKYSRNLILDQLYLSVSLSKRAFLTWWHNYIPYIYRNLHKSDWFLSHAVIPVVMLSSIKKYKLENLALPKERRCSGIVMCLRSRVRSHSCHSRVALTETQS